MDETNIPAPNKTTYLSFIRVAFFIGGSGADENLRTGFEKIAGSNIIRYIHVTHPTGHHIQRDVQN